jgi:hypothetical protein
MHLVLHDDLANAAMGTIVMCERAAPANFGRKIPYPTSREMGMV